MSILSTAAFGEALFKFKGKTFDSSKLDPKHKLKYYEAEAEFYQHREKIIQEAALDLYFEALAKKKGKTAGSLRSEHLQGSAPTEADLKAFYDKNRNKIPYPFEQVKSQITRFVAEEKRQKKRTEIIDKLKKKKEFSFVLRKPVAPKIAISTDGFHQKGNKSAKVTVVEFADYQCPHCKMAYESFSKVFKKYKNKINFVFIDFPIKGGSEEIAEGGVCAKEQKKYWEYHNAAFENQGKLKKAADIAAKIGLNKDDFQKCMDSKVGVELVKAGRAEGDRVGISGTPSMFINGYRFNGGFTQEAMSKAIDDALAGKKGAS